MIEHVYVYLICSNVCFSLRLAGDGAIHWRCPKIPVTRAALRHVRAHACRNAHEHAQSDRAVWMGSVRAREAVI